MIDGLFNGEEHLEWEQIIIVKSIQTFVGVIMFVLKETRSQYKEFMQEYNSVVFFILFCKLG